MRPAYDITIKHMHIVDAKGAQVPVSTCNKNIERGNICYFSRCYTSCDEPYIVTRFFPFLFLTSRSGRCEQMNERDRKEEQKLISNVFATATNCKELITQYSCEYPSLLSLHLPNQKFQCCCVWVRVRIFFSHRVSYHKNKNKNKIFLTRVARIVHMTRDQEIVNALQEL